MVCAKVLLCKKRLKGRKIQKKKKIRKGEGVWTRNLINHRADTWRWLSSRSMNCRHIEVIWKGLLRLEITSTFYSGGDCMDEDQLSSRASEGPVFGHGIYSLSLGFVIVSSGCTAIYLFVLFLEPVPFPTKKGKRKRKTYLFVFLIEHSTAIFLNVGIYIFS
ncbi:hypothetical protein ABZP36_024982 [Zizania latifolia]